MKKTLIIGPTYIDIISNVKELPKGNEDINILSSFQNVSGSGYHAAIIYNNLNFDYDLISPIGEGIYAEEIQQQVEVDNIPFNYHINAMNGCTYTLQDSNHETSRFIMPGAEYEFDRNFTEDIYPDEIKQVLIFGDMLTGSEESVNDLCMTLEDLDKPLLFVPNNRSQDILDSVLDFILMSQAIVITTDTEAYYLANEYSGEMRDVATHLNEITKNTVIIVKQGEGIFVKENEDSYFVDHTEHIDMDTLTVFYTIALECGVDAKNAIMFASEYSSSHDINYDEVKQRLTHFITLK